MNRFNILAPLAPLALALLFGQKLIAQSPTELGDIQGSTKVCAGGTFTFSVNPIVQIQEYHWSAPSGSHILGGQDSVVVFPPQGSSVQITFGYTGGQICVVAIPGHGAPLSTCIQVTVAPVPHTVLPPLVLTPQ